MDEIEVIRTIEELRKFLNDKSKKAHSNRLASLNEISDEDLITFKKDDLLRATEEMKLV